MTGKDIGVVGRNPTNNFLAAIQKIEVYNSFF